jgi:hypothetical protein
MNLSDKMKLYKTVERHECSDCGNKWYFDAPEWFECTTCARTHAKSSSLVTDDTKPNRLPPDDYNYPNSVVQDLHDKLAATQTENEKLRSAKFWPWQKRRLVILLGPFD